jgi:hypothetical protein
MDGAITVKGIEVDVAVPLETIGAAGSDRRGIDGYTNGLVDQHPVAAGTRPLRRGTGKGKVGKR